MYFLPGVWVWWFYLIGVAGGAGLFTSPSTCAGTCSVMLKCCPSPSFTELGHCPPNEWNSRKIPSNGSSKDSPYCCGIQLRNIIVASVNKIWHSRLAMSRVNGRETSRSCERLAGPVKQVGVVGHSLSQYPRRAVNKCMPIISSCSLFRFCPTHWLQMFRWPLDSWHLTISPR